MEIEWNLQRLHQQSTNGVAVTCDPGTCFEHKKIILVLARNDVALILKSHMKNEANMWTMALPVQKFVYSDTLLKLSMFSPEDC